MWRRGCSLAGLLRTRLNRSAGLLLGGPLALLMLGLGFGLQQLGAGLGGASLDDPILDALHAEPIEASTSRLQAARAKSRVSREPGQQDRLSLTEPDQAPALELDIRVALLSLGTNPRLGSSGTWQLRGASGQLLQQGGPGDVVDLQRVSAAGEAWLIPMAGASLMAADQPYGGRFRLVAQGDGVQVINHLGLEPYIAAVVGAEMPSDWPLQALMAQAVAARSYALAHMARPASRHWHLGDTTRWQAYRGQNRVTERTLSAASRTAGLILSYQGGIVESLYASTREISLEAHGHLGASMSQHGARALALDGHRYNAILGRYYPGASLARLRSGAG